MKFLDNFNTNLDAEYIHNRSFVVKNYFMYLLSSGKVVSYIIFLLVFLVFLYLQQQLFWVVLGNILNVVYVFLVSIWLFFHIKFLIGYIRYFRPYFDINGKKYLEKQDKRYEKALISSLVILIANVLVSLFSLFYLIQIEKIVWVIAFVITNLSLISTQWIIIKKSLIDFEMDFAVVDLKMGELIIVEQTWFLSKKIYGIRLNLISTITSSSSGLLRSWLGYGRIIITTVSDQPDMVMRYVKNPGLIEQMTKIAVNKTKKELGD